MEELQSGSEPMEVLLPHSAGRKRALSETLQQQTSAAEEPVFCQVCGKRERRYRCPRCSKLSCSLTCCVAHKTQEGCNGQRDRAKFVSLSNFTTGQLRSDYLFLEDALRLVDGAKRSLAVPAQGRGTAAQPKRRRQGQAPRILDATGVAGAGLKQGLPQPGGDWLDKHSLAVQALVKHVNSQGINLLLMPPGMSKRQANTTRYNAKLRKVVWKVEWVFKQAVSSSSSKQKGAATTNTSADHASSTAHNSSNSSSSSSSSSVFTEHTIVSEKVEETAQLSAVLARLLADRPGNASTRHTLARYCAVPLAELSLLIRRLPCSAARPSYAPLDAAATLQESLRSRTVIEYPTIYVALPAEREAYPTLVADVSSADSSSAADAEVEEGELSSDDSSSSDNGSDSGSSEDDDSTSISAKLSQEQVAAAAGDFIAALTEIESMDAETVKRIGTAEL
jgi:HIT zinc finger